MKLVPFEGVPLESLPKRTTEEAHLLQKGCEFIRDIGKRVGYPYLTTLTAQWYFRKFFVSRPLGSVPHLDIALTAVLLASKVEDTFDKIRHVLVAAFLVLNPDSFKDNPDDIKITEEHRRRVIQYEREMLISVGFNFNLTHAHPVALKMAKQLNLLDELKLAWRRLDEIYTEADLILVYPPHVLAVSVLLEVTEDQGKREKIKHWCRDNRLAVHRVVLKGAMNEHKIQLESREDLQFLKNEFVNYANKSADSASTISESLKQQYFDRVFAIVTENIQINGADWAEIVSKNSAMEAVNTELVNSLQEMQVETEQLMRRVIEYRKVMPQKAAEVFQEESERILDTISEQRTAPLSDIENISPANLSDSHLPKLTAGLENLTVLQKSIPDVVAKLGRAQAVIKEEGRKRADHENTQLMNRHRRLSRQFDLASKLNN